MVRRPIRDMLKDEAIDRAKKAIDKLKKAFPDYEIENITAELELKTASVGGSLQVKIKPKKP